jgi:hypothetical protein
VGDTFDMQVIEVSNPAAPHLVGSCSTSQGHDVALAGSFAYVADGHFGLRVIAVFQPLEDVTFVDTDTLTAVVPFGQRLGTWNLHVTNPDGGYSMLPNGFTVTQPGGAPVIEKIGNRKCYPGERIRIIGSGFGEIQGDSVVHLNNLTYGPGHNRIRSWSDTMIRLKVPYNSKPCAWYTHGDGQYRRRSVWVTVDGVDSNKKAFKILKPATCQ